MAMGIADRVEPPTLDDFAVSGYYHVVPDGSVATNTNGYYYPQSDTGGITTEPTYLHLPQQPQQQDARDPHTVGIPSPFANAMGMCHHGVSEAPAMTMQYRQSHPQVQIQVAPAAAVSAGPRDDHSAGSSSPWTVVDPEWDSDNFSYRGSPHPGSPPVTTYNQAPISPVSWPSPVSLSSPCSLPYQEDDQKQQQQKHIQSIPPPARITSSPAPNDNGAAMYHAQQMAGMYSPTSHPFVMADRIVGSEQQQSSPAMAMSSMPAAQHRQQHLMQTPFVPLSSNGDAAGMNSPGGVKPEDDEMALDKDDTNDLPYAKLIYKALLSHPQHAMTLQEVYDWFMINTNKDKTNRGWQNSVRHNLSLNKAFQKRDLNLSQGDTSPSSSNLKKKNEWYLEDWAIAEGGVQSTTKYRTAPTKKSKARSTTSASAVPKMAAGGGVTSHANQVLQHSRAVMGGGGASGRRLSGQRGGRASSRQRNLQRLQGIPEVPLQVQVPPTPPTSDRAAGYHPGSSSATCTTGINATHHWDVTAESSISVQLESSGYLTPDGTPSRAAPQDGFGAPTAVIDEQPGEYFGPGGTTQVGGGGGFGVDSQAGMGYLPPGGDYSAEMGQFGLSDVEGVFPDGALFVRLSLRGPHGHVQNFQ
ncbi:uncharacterized protein DNG_05225 [Cephalotrichum gorgonifer]|uniref:Fork-head domain-containing protein n=1 Tax=Cephalotrichum gorgonifer TaxID=2041049 RepID=A0AAE8SW32_9PEZI|nr:uncharacterized protein DNG_05225 [Cephalotrichum gorgonifer]